MAIEICSIDLPMNIKIKQEEARSSESYDFFSKLAQCCDSPAFCLNKHKDYTWPPVISSNNTISAFAPTSWIYQIECTSCLRPGMWAYTDLEARAFWNTELEIDKHKEEIKTISKPTSTELQLDIDFF